MSRSNFQTSQNVDNFIREKPSTRLHAPPGGGSTVGSLIYGGDGCDESPFVGHERRNSVVRRKEEAPEQSNPYGRDYHRNSGSAGDYSQPPAGYQQQPVQQPPVAGQRQSSSNQYANGSNQNAGNVLTDRRITRIHAPPGSASSIIFG